MLLIADSGSTKTDWVFCNTENGVIKIVSSVGFNPIVQSENFIREKINETFKDIPEVQIVTHIYFFGAGCSSSSRKNIIKVILKKVFRNAIIEVDHDMKAAVIATCGDEPGFACILGTGSNAVFYDGKNIIEPKGALGIGYILGDEGSGSAIGKILLRDFLYQQMPEKLYHYFKENLKLEKDIIFKNVYQLPNANTYLASFTKEIFDFRELDYVQALIKTVFTDFFNYNIIPYSQDKEYPIHFIGSIALHYEKELNEVAETFQLKIGKIIQKPIDQIVSYYIDKINSSTH
jgi:glucosamine kinase